ncbi:MAG: DUF4872 domain-containing protein [Acidobacteriota bacterium]
MSKTGERYAAARLALLKNASSNADSPAAEAVPPGTILTDLGALAMALQAAGIVDPATGAPFSETRLFGLSGGPGFMSFVFQYQNVAPILTITCRSFSLPGPVVDRALEHAGINPDRFESGSTSKSRRALDQVLEQSRVAHLAVDQARLPWLGLDPIWQGQWPRHVNVSKVGDAFRVQDQAQWTLSEEQLAAARAGIKKAKHRMLSFGDTTVGDPVAATRQALEFYVSNQRTAPYANFKNNFGLKGLARTAQAMGDLTTKKGWLRTFDSGPYAFAALWRLWECLTVELTAPAAGRPLFADFLEQASELPGCPDLRSAAELARASGEAFEDLVDLAVAAGGGPLGQAIEWTEAIDEALRSGAPDTPETVRELRARRAALAAQCTLDEASRREVFTALAAQMNRILDRETALVEALERKP